MKNPLEKFIVNKKDVKSITGKEISLRKTITILDDGRIGLSRKYKIYLHKSGYLFNIIKNRLEWGRAKGKLADDSKNYFMYNIHKKKIKEGCQGINKDIPCINQMSAPHLPRKINELKKILNCTYQQALVRVSGFLHYDHNVQEEKEYKIARLTSPIRSAKKKNSKGYKKHIKLFKRETSKCTIRCEQCHGLKTQLEKDYPPQINLNNLYEYLEKNNPEELALLEKLFPEKIEDLKISSMTKKEHKEYVRYRITKIKLLSYSDNFDVLVTRNGVEVEMTTYYDLVENHKEKYPNVLWTSIRRILSKKQVETKEGYCFIDMSDKKNYLSGSWFMGNGIFV